MKFLSVGCGDGICLRFFGNDGFFHNILIDGGVEKGDIYPATLKKEITAIKERNEKIDLWILTHIDDDHIGGILRFIKDITLFKEIDLSATRFWFNYSNMDYETGIKADKFKSVKQGIRLRDFIRENALLQQFITNELHLVNFFGLKFSILSPDTQSLANLIRDWKKEEIKIKSKKTAAHKSSTPHDYDVKITDFDLSKEKTDTSPTNKSSIAFILEYDSKKVLFSSDAHPSVLENSLVRFGYSNENKLELEYMQAPHHGSKFNITEGLLRLISCSNFIISADGFNSDNLPNKQTLARIIRHNNLRPANFFITHKNSLTKSIFFIDGNIENVSLNFPKEGSAALVFNL